MIRSKIFKQLFCDKHGRPAIIQWPNPPLWTWIIASALGYVIHGRWHFVVSVLGSLALAVWAFIELARGASLFRKVLGGVVLLYLLVTFGLRLIH